MKIKFYNPKIFINKRRTPILYIDTYLWYDIFKKHQNELDLLKNCCESKLIIIALTNAIIGELKQRNIFDEIKSICGDSLVSVPLGRVSANQVIHSMLCFFNNKKTINIDWNLATSEVPVLEGKNAGLKAIVDNLRNEMNNANAKYYGSKETLISIFVGLERHIWKDALRVYGEILNNGLFANAKKENLYGNYFLTDYFSLLPCVVIRSSLFAYLYWSSLGVFLSIILFISNVTILGIIKCGLKLIYSDPKPPCLAFINIYDKRSSINTQVSNTSILFGTLNIASILKGGIENFSIKLSNNCSGFIMFSCGSTRRINSFSPKTSKESMIDSSNSSKNIVTSALLSKPCI